MRFTFRKILAISLCIITLVQSGMLPAFAEDYGQPTGGENTRAAQTPVPEENADAVGAGSSSSTYYEVKFQMPDDLAWAAELQEKLSEEEAAEEATEENGSEEEPEQNDYTVDVLELPETQMVVAGTPISTLPTPKLFGYVFLGWYYDKDYQNRVGSEDLVNRNLTLYAKFVSANDNSGEVSLNYTSDRDVSPDFKIYLAAYGLTETEIRANLAVRDFGSLEEEMEYTLTRQEPDLLTLIPDNKMRATARRLLDEYRNGMDVSEAQDTRGEDPELWIPGENVAGEFESLPEGKTLSERLRAAGLTDAQAKVLVGYYAPEELPALESAVLREMMIALGFSGDESPEEVLRLLKETYANEEDLIEYLNGHLGLAVNSAEELDALEPQDVLSGMLEQAWDGDAEQPDLWVLLPASGKWSRGKTEQVEILNTEKLRFWKNEEETPAEVVYYNFVISQEDYVDTKLASAVIQVPASEVDGIDLGEGLIKLSQDDYGDVDALLNDRSGEFTYHGEQTLEVGDILCVHEDGFEFIQSFGVTGETPITYVKITEDLGSGHFAYITPEMDEVIFTPDNIPVRDDGSFDDGVIMLTDDQMDFSDPFYREIGVKEDLVVESGDLITVYTGELGEGSLVGYGRITEVSRAEDGLLLGYDIIDEEQLEDAGGFSVHVDNVPFPLTEDDLKTLADDAVRELEEKHALRDVQGYITALVMAEDYELENPEFGDSLKEIHFATDTGEEISLEEIRRLGADVKWDPKPTLTTQVALTLKHFNGTGLRQMISYGTGCTMKFNNAQGKGEQLRLDLKIQFEMEFCGGISVDSWVDWGKAWVVKYPEGWKVYGALDVGFFTALGVTATLQTQMQSEEKTALEDKMKSILGSERLAGSKEQQDSWTSSLMSAGNFFSDVSKYCGFISEGAVEKNGEFQDVGTSGGDTIGGSSVHDPKTKFYGKYSQFLSNSAQFIPIYEKDLIPQSTVFTVGIVEVSFGVKFVLAWKLNVMIGATLQYGIAKQSSVTVQFPSMEKKTNSADLETPNFTFDFYMFGQVGIKASLVADLRLGILSAKLDSIGIVVEVGFQIMFYGFFYFSAGWTSGKGWDYDAVGTMLLEAALVASGKLKAQIGDDALKKEIEIFKARWPIATLGTEKVYVDAYNLEDSELYLDLGSSGYYQMQEDPDKEGYDHLLNILAMEVHNGLTEEDGNNMDSSAAVPGSYSVTSMGETVEQMNEEFFDIVCLDTDANGQTTGTCSWWVDTINNRIYPKPHDVSNDELWGEIHYTFHNYSKPGTHHKGDGDKVSAVANYGMGFGIQKETVERVFKVHWKGIKTTPVAEVYYQKDPYEKIEDVSQLAHASEEDLARLYEKVDEHALDETFVGMLSRVGTDHPAFQADPNYEVVFIAEPYDEAVTRYYEDNTFGFKPMLEANAVRNQVYANTRGYVWTLPCDTVHPFFVDGENARIRVYYNRKMSDSHWLMLDAQNENQVGFGTQDASLPQGDGIAAYVPADIAAWMTDETYAYDTYLVYAEDMPSAVRNRLRQGYGLRFYPSAMPDRTNWIPVTGETVVPDREFYIITERRPFTNMVTWMYDDGARLTFVKAGDPLEEPELPVRAGHRLLYWADEDGQQYEVMPDRDLILYPVFLGKEHQITWVYAGDRIVTQIRTGDGIMEQCPFEPDEGEVFRWRINSSRSGEIVQENAVMPDANLILYGSKYAYKTVTWMDGDEVLARTKEEIGQPLPLLVPEAEYYMVCRWLKDGMPLPEGYVMPAEDITLQAFWYDSYHDHEWEPVGDYEEPDCVHGSVVHVLCPFCLEEKDEELPANPDAHLWGEIVYTWDQDNESVTAMRTCLHDAAHVESETAIAFRHGIEDPDCEIDRTITLTASFANILFEKQTKEIVIPAKGHEPGEPVKMDEVEPTCEKGGSYDEVVFCLTCRKELSRKKVEVEKTDEHTPAEAVREKEKNATCNEEGSYDEVVYCAVCGQELSRKNVTVEKLPHEPGKPVREHEKAVSCTEEGNYDEVVYCTLCDQELSRKNVTVEKLSHVPGKPVREHEKAGACNEEGSYDEVVYCTRCGQELSRKTVKLNKLPHKPGEAEKENLIEATCTQEGSYDMVTYCTVCGEVIRTRHWTIARTEHKRDEIVKENYIPSTCGHEGSYDEVIYCKVCGKELYRASRTEPQLAHTEGKPVKENTTEGFCLEGGTYDEVIYCVYCGEEMSRETKTDPAPGHTPLDPVFENEVQATCETSGSRDEVTYCAVCGQEASRETKIFPALGHKPLSAVRENEVKPTCESGGGYEEVVRCSGCGKELSRNTKKLKPLGHKPLAAVKENEVKPTCETKGSYDEVIYCSVCSKEISRKTKTVKPLAHKPLGAVKENEIAPTCEAKGSYDEVVYCSACGKEISRKTKTVKALGHKPLDAVKENDIAPTCEAEGGYDMVVYCSACGKELSRETKKLDALGHKPSDKVRENDTAPTCEAEGSYDEVVHCSVCQKVLSRETKIQPALGHKPLGAVKENEVKPTCKADGSYDSVIHCATCGKELSRDTTVVPALGHSPKEAVKENESAPTCEAGGSYDLVVYCSACGEELSRDKVNVAALGHSPKEAVKENETHTDAGSPCESEGSYDMVVYCSRCGKELNRETHAIAATGHSPKSAVKEKEVAPTCEKKGSYDEVVYCSVCGKEISRQAKTTSALGHKAGQAVKENEVAATCEDKGSYDEVVYCTVCRKELSRDTRTTPALGHKAGQTVKEKEVAATCEDKGSYDEAVYCSVCGKELSRDTKTTPALGHKPGQAVKDNEIAPTCAKEGSYDEIVSCTVCKKELSREAKFIPKLEHSPGQTLTENVVAPACETNGSYDAVIYCSVCGEEFSREAKVEPALGHTEGQAVKENEKAATCEDKGSYDEVVYCSVCGKELRRNAREIPATGHTPATAVQENVRDSTCKAEGSYDEVVYCDICGKELSRVAKPIAVLEHTPADPVRENEVAAECVDDGSYDEVTYCSVCGDELVREKKTIKAPGHTPKDPVREHEVAATCLKNGIYDSVVYCNICGAEISREADIVVPAPGHKPGDPVDENRVEPTCTEDGSVERVWYCTVCGEVTDYELIKEPALGHDYEEVLDLFEPYLVKTDAYDKITDFVPSRKVFECNRCQNIEYVYVKAEIKPFTNMDDFVFNGYTAYITDGDIRYSGYTVQDLVDIFVKLKIGNVYKNNYEDIDFMPPGKLKIMYDSGDICLWEHPGETIIVSLYYEPDDWQYYEDCQFNIHITVPESEDDPY